MEAQISKGAKIDCSSFVMCPLLGQLIIGFFSFLFLLRPFTVLMKQTRQMVRAVKQSIIFLDVYEWKRINCKQIVRWQHLSRLKASAFLFEFFFFFFFWFGIQKCNNLYSEIGSTIQWMIEPHWVLKLTHLSPGPNVIKLSTAVIYEFFDNKLECLYLASLCSII